jgi:hypothetical protein
MNRRIILTGVDMAVSADGGAGHLFTDFDEGDYPLLWAKVAQGINEGAKEILVGVIVAPGRSINISRKIDKRTRRLAQSAMRKLEQLWQRLYPGLSVRAEPEGEKARQ